MISLLLAAALALPNDGAQVIQVSAKKFEFSPAVIELKIGVPVVTVHDVSNVFPKKVCGRKKTFPSWFALQLSTSNGSHLPGTK